MPYCFRSLLVVASVILMFSCAEILLRMQSAQLLRYRFTTGQVDKYLVDVRVKVNSAERIPELTTRTIRGTGSNFVRVLKVNPDGSARIQIDVQPLRMAGARDSTLTTQSVTFTLNPRGKGPTATLVRGKALSPSDLFVDPSALSRLGAILPPNRVKPGDQWTSTTPNPFQSTGYVTISSRYFAPDRVHGVPTVRIHQTMMLPIATRMIPPGGTGIVKAHGWMKVNSAVHFAHSLGKVIRSSSLGNGKVRLTTQSKGAPEESVTLTLNVDAVSELVEH